MDGSLTGRSILIVEDEPLIVMDITKAFEGSGAELTTTNTLRHALLLVEHDGLSAAILWITRSVTVTVPYYTRASGSGAYPSSSIAGMKKWKAPAMARRISPNQRPPRCYLRRWKI